MSVLERLDKFNITKNQGFWPTSIIGHLETPRDTPKKLPGTQENFPDTLKTLPDSQTVYFQARKSRLVPEGFMTAELLQKLQIYELFGCDVFQLFVGCYPARKNS